MSQYGRKVLRLYTYDYKHFLCHTFVLLVEVAVKIVVEMIVSGLCKGHTDQTHFVGVAMTEIVLVVDLIEFYYLPVV